MSGYTEAQSDDVDGLYRGNFFQLLPKLKTSQIPFPPITTQTPNKTCPTQVTNSNNLQSPRAIYEPLNLFTNRPSHLQIMRFYEILLHHQIGNIANRTSLPFPTTATNTRLSNEISSFLPPHKAFKFPMLIVRETLNRLARPSLGVEGVRLKGYELNT